MDHYKALGLHRNASKEEIKEAFRNLAMKFHPDKHSQSPDAVRENATLKFKQVSEAYEILIDDRKRADYNIRSNARTGNSSYGGGFSGEYGYGYHNSYGESRYRNRPPPPWRSAINFFEVALQFLTTRAFLLNVAFAGVIFGGMVAIDVSGEALWKARNSGKSFEEAMESIEKSKTREDGM